MLHVVGRGGDGRASGRLGRRDVHAEWVQTVHGAAQSTRTIRVYDRDLVLIEHEFRAGGLAEAGDREEVARCISRRNELHGRRDTANLGVARVACRALDGRALGVSAYVERGVSSRAGKPFEVVLHQGDVGAGVEHEFDLDRRPGRSRVAGTERELAARSAHLLAALKMDSPFVRWLGIIVQECIILRRLRLGHSRQERSGRILSTWSAAGGAGRRRAARVGVDGGELARALEFTVLVLEDAVHRRRYDSLGAVDDLVSRRQDRQAVDANARRRELDGTRAETRLALGAALFAHPSTVRVSGGRQLAALRAVPR